MWNFSLYSSNCNSNNSASVIMICLCLVQVWFLFVFCHVTCFIMSQLIVALIPMTIFLCRFVQKHKNPAPQTPPTKNQIKNTPKTKNQKNPNPKTKTKQKTPKTKKFHLEKKEQWKIFMNRQKSTLKPIQVMACFLMAYFPCSVLHGHALAHLCCWFWDTQLCKFPFNGN